MSQRDAKGFAEAKPSATRVSSVSTRTKRLRRRNRSAYSLHVFAIFLLSFIAPSSCQECIPPLLTSKQQVYKVGVLAITGIQSAYDDYNATFSEYLTASAGTRFVPPIRFEMEPLDISLSSIDDMDFLYVNPFVFSCVESERGAHALVSQVSRRVVGGTVYNLTKFGGVIFTRADSNISSIQDIKGKVVACASIRGFGSGQMQFRELQRAGLSYINDPEQLVFTFNQTKVVEGVLDGNFDVGFVRTDQIERSLGEDYASQIKIIASKENLEIDGVPFPFQSSTQLYPEWNVVSLAHVPNEVAIEVQQALLALADHAAVGNDLTRCYAENDCDGNDDRARERCRSSCEDDIQPLMRCDTTVQVAVAANAASIKQGTYAAFRTALSYAELRSLQEDTQYLTRNETSGLRKCLHSSNIYDAIACPFGYYRKPEKEVAYGCAIEGLACREDFFCICSPCGKMPEVEVFSPLSSGTGCSRLELCGTTQQTKSLTFRVIDKTRRFGLDLTVRILELKKSREIHPFPVASHLIRSKDRNETSYEYEFSVESNLVGVLLVEILANGEHIPASPIRVEVKPRDCAAELNNALLTADTNGQCICNSNSGDIAGRCVAYSVLLPSFLLPLVGIVTIIAFVYTERRRKQADTFWSVKKSELLFNDPPEIIGRGTFGLVLLAEYRGTQVAVKRVMPPKATQMPILARSKARTTESGSCSSTSLDVEHGPSAAKKISENQHVQTDALCDDYSFGRQYSFNDIGGTAFDFAAENVTGRSSPRLGQSLDDLSLTTRPRMRSMGHAPSTSSSHVTDDLSGMDSIRQMPRRHSTGNYTFSSLVLFSPILGMSNGGESGMKSVQPTVGNIEPVSLVAKKSGSDALSISTAYQSRLDRKGLFGTVWSRRTAYNRLKADFIAEMRHLSKLRHPCITTVMGAIISKEDEPMLVMEFMEMGSLYDILHNETIVLDGDLVLPILRDITRGMRFLHAASPQVIHGDLKALNVLVDSNFRAKVCDFGLSQKKHVGATGTPLWMAPELLRGESDNTAASDVYSFGIILYEVYSREDPYAGEDTRVVINQVVDPTVNKRPPVPSSCPPLTATLMTDCLVANPSDRPTFQDLDSRLKQMHVSSVEPGKMQFSRQTKKEQRHPDLLNEVFPKHIAEALREGRKVEPESRDCVTIFFSDIVGFTNISSTMSPIKVSDLLDRLYLRFDMLSHKHDVFKVETIGDAYMAATNLVKGQDDHVKRIAEFAIDAVKAANGTLIDRDDPSKGFVKVRVGFHSGPVVANVVGSRSRRYSLFGDTVNTAARMESSSHENRIQCSDRSAGLLQLHHPEIKLAPRGNIKIKGKGEIHTYWVNEE